MCVSLCARFTEEEGGEKAIAQSVKHATPDQQVVGSIPALAACYLLVGSVSICDRLRQKLWSPHSVSVFQCNVTG